MGQLRNPHPGEILKEEFLNEIAVSQNQLAISTEEKHHSNIACLSRSGPLA